MSPLTLCELLFTLWSNKTGSHLPYRLIHVPQPNRRDRGIKMTLHSVSKSPSHPSSRRSRRCARAVGPRAAVPARPMQPPPSADIGSVGLGRTDWRTPDARDGRTGRIHCRPPTYCLFCVATPSRTRSFAGKYGTNYVAIDDRKIEGQAVPVPNMDLRPWQGVGIDPLAEFFLENSAGWTRNSADIRISRICT